MSLQNYQDWVMANYSTPEGQAFMLGVGLGVLVQMIRWCLRALKKGGNFPS